MLDVEKSREKAAGGNEPEPPVSHPPRRHLSDLQWIQRI